MTGPKPDSPTNGPLKMELTVNLLLRAKAGDADAVNEVCRRFFPRLENAARGRLPAAARGLLQTEDLASEILMAAISKISALDFPTSRAFFGYLRKSLANRLANEWEAASRRPRPGELHSGIPDEALSPHDEQIAKEATVQLDRALSTLSQDDQLLVFVRADLQLSFEEVASIVGKPSADAARKAFARAVDALEREIDRIEKQAEN